MPPYEYFLRYIAVYQHITPPHEFQDKLQLPKTFFDNFSDKNFVSSKKRPYFAKKLPVIEQKPRRGPAAGNAVWKRYAIRRDIHDILSKKRILGAYS